MDWSLCKRIRYLYMFIRAAGGSFSSEEFKKKKTEAHQMIKKLVHRENEKEYRWRGQKLLNLVF